MKRAGDFDWKLLESVAEKETGNAQSDACVDVLPRCCSNLVSQNPSEFPDIMNKYFSAIEHNLASKMPNSPKQFTEYLLIKVRLATSFLFNPVSPSEIAYVIMTIQLNNVHGLF